jgi:hypothetical protein
VSIDPATTLVESLLFKKFSSLQTLFKKSIEGKNGQQLKKKYGGA